MSEKMNSHTSDIAGVPHKRSRFWRVCIVFVLVIAVVGLGYGTLFLYKARTKSNAYFMNILHQYDGSDKKLREGWSEVLLKVKTPMHYLMLLKRLDAYGLINEYQKTLVRALWKFPDISSLLALAVEYVLTHDDGNVFSPYLKNLDSLWEQYPNLVRLYYAHNFSDKALSLVNDELLQLYYRIKTSTITWEGYNTLWQITNEPVFLFLSSAYAGAQGNYDIATQLFETIPLIWNNAHPKESAALAWVLRNTKEFENRTKISSDSKDIDFKLAILHALENDFVRARTVLQSMQENYSDDTLSNRYWEFYLWVLRAADTNPETILRTYNSIEHRFRHSPTLVMSYLSYLYNTNKDMLKVFVDTYEDTSILQQNEQIRFFVFLSKHHTSQQLISRLWTNINNAKNAGDSSALVFWLEVSTGYFINLNDSNNTSVLFENYTSFIEMLPYKFLFELSVQQHETISKDTMKMIQKNTEHTFPWWHYYNLALWHINQGKYTMAYTYLQQAEEYMPIKTSVSMQSYVYLQYARLAILQDNMEEAQAMVKRVEVLLPISPYLPKIQEQLGYLEDKEALQSGANTR